MKTHARVVVIGGGVVEGRQEHCPIRSRCSRPGNRR